jgi:hypothetical protein
MRRDGRVIVADVLLVSSKIGRTSLGPKFHSKEHRSISRGCIGLNPCRLVISQDMVIHGEGMHFGAGLSESDNQIRSSDIVCNVSLQLRCHVHDDVLDQFPMSNHPFKHGDVSGAYQVL